MEPHERGDHLADGRPAPIDGVPAEVVLTAERCEVHVPIPDDGHVVVDARERRPEVVARLLALGVSTETLITLLPDWEPLILQVATTHDSTVN